MRRLFLFCFAAPLFGAVEPSFYLPEGARPLRYRLDLRIDPSQPAFEGSQLVFEGSQPAFDASQPAFDDPERARDSTPTPRKDSGRDHERPTRRRYASFIHRCRPSATVDMSSTRLTCP